MLTVIINSVNKLESVPLHIKRRIIVDIDKPGKYPTYKDNNRFIRIGLVICKVWEKVIMLWFEPWIRENKIIDGHKDVVI